MEQNLIDVFRMTPIAKEYSQPSQQDIAQLKIENKACRIYDAAGIVVENAYFNAGYPGSQESVYTRESVLLRLKKAVEILQPDAYFSIFDAYRSIETQVYLYEMFRENLRQEHPHLNADELEALTLTFVSHPFDTSRFAVPLHNSGGAIDLEIVDQDTGTPWDFGTEIDETVDASRTDFFEQPFNIDFGFSEVTWERIRSNRRVLFHLMKYVGFVNYEHEWWHYDLGSCHWARVLGMDWHYPSMEKEVSSRHTAA